MLLLSDLAASVIGHILGQSDSSYLVIRLWLCGSKLLQRKLSTGVTFLDLKCHPLGSFPFPQVVSQLRQLRHISISTVLDLRQGPTWPEILRSLPTTLESLAIAARDFRVCYANINRTTDHPIQTTYSRGQSAAVELDRLFPRLHTLALSSTTSFRARATSDLFPALPSSLTRLDAPLALDYDKAPSHLSKLPPNIMYLNKSISWAPYNELSFPAEIALRQDMANAPPNLQTFTAAISQPWGTYLDLEDSTCDCWLPRSLSEIDWSREGPSWSAKIALSVPPNLHTLGLCSIDEASFCREPSDNWIIALPRTLTKLTVLVDKVHINFASYGHLLPRTLTELALGSPKGLRSINAFGAWSEVTAVNYWPPKLTTLSLPRLRCEPTLLPYILPQTLTKLNIYIDPSLDFREWSTANALPPALTHLELGWSFSLDIKLDFAKYNLETCILNCSDSELFFGPSALQQFNFPPSLTTLHLNGLKLSAVSTLEISNDDPFPNLKHLSVREMDWGWFGKLPSLQSLEVLTVTGFSESPLVADGKLFRDLPSSLTYLHVNGHDGSHLDLLPPQSLVHMTELRDLELGYAWRSSSKILRLLPKTLKRLMLVIIAWDEHDLPHIPPHLENYPFTASLTPTIAKYLPLQSLAHAEYRESSCKSIATERVLQAAKNQ